MASEDVKPWSPYDYPSSWLANAEYRLKDGYAFIGIPKGTVLYHGSRTLPITISASGKTALPDTLYPNSYLADADKCRAWGFPFAFVCKRDVLLLDTLSKWNLTKLLERTDMSETEKQALRDVTGFGKTRELRARSPGNHYRNKPKLSTRWLLGPEDGQKRTVADWVCTHGFHGSGRDDFLFPTSKEPFDHKGRAVIAKPSVFLRPVRITLSKLTKADRSELLCEDRLVRSAGDR